MPKSLSIQRIHSLNSSFTYLNIPYITLVELLAARKSHEWKETVTRIDQSNYKLISLSASDSVYHIHIPFSNNQSTPYMPLYPSSKAYSQIHSGDMVESVCYTHSFIPLQRRHVLNYKVNRIAREYTLFIYRKKNIYSKLRWIFVTYTVEGRNPIAVYFHKSIKLYTRGVGTNKKTTTK